MPDPQPEPLPPSASSDIEERLRASAQRRRAEFDAEPAARMPAAMRARLQEEVSGRAALAEEAVPVADRDDDDAADDASARRRRFLRKPGQAWFLAWFWPRLALVAAALVALVVTPLFWRRGQPEQNTMQNRVATAPGERRMMGAPHATTTALSPSRRVRSR